MTAALPSYTTSGDVTYGNFRMRGLAGFCFIATNDLTQVRLQL